MKKTLLVSIRLVALFALLGALALAGCENGDGGTKVPFLVSITIEGAPETYAAGADLNVGGLTVTLTYSNGLASSVTLPEGTVGVLDEAGDLTYTAGGITIIISGYNPDETGDQTITVTVGSKTEEYTITLSSTTTDKAAFNTAIAAANTAKVDVVVDTDAANVAIGTEWVTQEVLAAFNTAIATAEGVATDSEASADQITDAVTALNAAIATFKTAKKTGTGTDIVNANKAALNTAIAGASAAKTGVVVDSAAANVATGTKWVTQGALSTFNAAISAAEGVSFKNRATQAEVDSAVTTLNSAKDTFNAAKKDGTKANEVSVDKPALTTAITTANSAKSGVVVDTAAANVATGTKWVTQGAWDALATAITNAETVSANNGATQAQVSSAVTALNTAVTTFNNAKKDGTKTGGVTINKTALNTAITTANAAKVGVVVATDAATVAPGTKWVTQGALDTFTTAIATADGVAANNSATQAVVDSAVTTLNAAKDTFNDAKKDGAKADVSIVTHTVTFNTGADGPVVAAKTVSTGGTVERPADPTKDGVTFDDWYTTAGLTTKYTFTAAVTGNITLYARWTATLTFRDVDETVIDAKTVSAGETIVRPTDPAKPGYVFDNWYTAKDSDTLYTFAAVNSNTTVYAKWLSEAEVAAKKVADAKAILSGKITDAQVLSLTMTNDIYQAAIAAALSVQNNAGATLELVTGATTTLNNATTVFNAVVAAKALLQAAITEATTTKNTAGLVDTAFVEGTEYAAGAVFTTGSASDIPKGLKRLTVTDPRTAYQSAIETAQAVHTSAAKTAAETTTAEETLASATTTFTSAVSSAKSSATPGALGLAARVSAATTNTTIYLYSDESDFAGIGSGEFNIVNKTITLQGVGEERTITLVSNGRMFRIDGTSSLTLDTYVTLQGKSDNTGSLVNANVNGAVFTMKAGSKITGNTTSASGGGVLVASGGTFNMEGGEISYNESTTAANGGGVYVNGNTDNPNVTTFNMTGGEISYNTAARGGGVFIDNKGKFNLSGNSVISHNHATNGVKTGGGVNVDGGEFKMLSGTISDNEAGTNGGGVYVGGSSTFSMEGGVIKTNKTTGAPNNGGGVYVYNAATSKFYMSGGTITADNSATNGKALFKNTAGIAKWGTPESLLAFIKGDESTVGNVETTIHGGSPGSIE
ncbi:beta strand repeat-containing protein [Treponema primitia]|uniref:beta strand repeat-containing protein n=1 Tax=Treponema primitia TaxID=88058 RepID=UPI00145DBACE|nr:InlB B-repeat-containing protein [Treponema primitia]